jgi:site-specific recombinase XerD
VFHLRKDVPGTWEEALEEFLFWKRAQAVSETTVNDYRRVIALFFRRYPEAVEHGQFRSCVLKHMAQPGISPSTYNLRLVYIRAFFAWCLQEGLIKRNPLAGFKRRKAASRIVSIDEAVLTRLLELPDKSTFVGLRDYALLLLTLDTGIRPSEALQLLVGDCNLRSLEITVRAEAAKTRDWRTLPVSPVTGNAINELIAVRPSTWDTAGSVFCTWEGRQLSLEGWRARLDYYSEKLGTKIRPYDLRHAFALEFLRNGGNAFALQRTLGHTDLAMTKRYIALTREDLREQHTQASPLGKLIPKKERITRIKN